MTCLSCIVTKLRLQQSAVRDDRGRPIPGMRSIEVITFYYILYYIALF